jgi:hypothetical protein
LKKKHEFFFQKNPKRARRPQAERTGDAPISHTRKGYAQTGIEKKMYKTLFITLALLIPTPLLASTLLFAPTGFSSSTADVFKTSGQAMTYIHIDCGALGWGEIDGIGLTSRTSSGSANFRLGELTTGVISTNAPTITTSDSNTFHTFSPAIYCSGKTLVFARTDGSGTGSTINIQGTGSGSEMLKGSWSICTDGTGCQGMTFRGSDPIMYVYGAVSTTTESTGGGNSTTTYEFYTATTSPSTSIDNMSMILFTFLLILVVYMTGALAYNIVYGRFRPT